MLVHYKCSVQKGKDSTAVWVFRRRGEKEKYLPHNVNRWLPGGGASLMVWACFTSNIKGPFIPIYGRATADSYLLLLELHLLPYLNQLAARNIEGVIFQQDNASIHKAHKV